MVSRKTLSQSNSAFIAGDYTGSHLLFRVAAKDASTTSPFSDEYEVASLAVDNSAPATPTLVYRTGSYTTGGTIMIDAPGLNGVRITSVDSGNPGYNIDAKSRPGQYAITYIGVGVPFTVTVTLYSSNGTASTPLVVNINT